MQAMAIFLQSHLFDITLILPNYSSVRICTDGVPVQYVSIHAGTRVQF